MGRTPLRSHPYMFRTTDFPDDPDDAKFLACAVVANADFLITGDAALSQAQNLGETAIVAVATFKALFCDVR